MISKFQACLLGCAIGDALAAPYEDTVISISENEKKVEFYSKALSSHPLSHLTPGQYSDETQITLKVAESLIESKGFNAENLCDKFIEWYQSQKKRAEWRFPGNTMLNACRKLASGVSVSLSGFQSAGVLASVRTIPYALAFYKQRDKLTQAIYCSCKITHADPRVASVAEVLAAIIGMGVSGKEFSSSAILNKAIEVAAPKNQELLQKLNIIRSCLNSSETEDTAGLLGNSGYCIEAFSAAVYYLIKSNGDFDKAVISAANSGGDNDAIAAMAGAMCGSFVGLAGISQKWLDKLENCDLIRQMACDIYNLAAER